MKKIIASFLAVLILFGTITCSAASYGLNKPATVGGVSITVTGCKVIAAYNNKFDYALLSINIKNKSAKEYTFCKMYFHSTCATAYDVGNFDVSYNRVKVPPKGKKSTTIKYMLAKTSNKISLSYAFINYDDKYFSDFKACFAHKMTVKQFANKYKKAVSLYFTVPVTK